MGKTSPDEVSLHIALDFCKIHLGGCYGCTLWICHLAKKVLCSLVAEEHEWYAVCQILWSAADVPSSTNRSKGEDRAVTLPRGHCFCLSQCLPLLCYSISHTSVSVFIVGCGCGEGWRRGDGVWMWGGGAYRCAFMCWFMRHIEHNSLTSSTEIFQGLLLREEVVMATCFSSIFFSFSESILTIALDICLCDEVFREDTLFLSALFISSFPRGSDWRWVLSADNNDFTFNPHSIAVP